MLSGNPEEINMKSVSKYAGCLLISPNDSVHFLLQKAFYKKIITEKYKLIKVQGFFLLLLLVFL